MPAVQGLWLFGVMPWHAHASTRMPSRCSAGAMEARVSSATASSTCPTCLARQVMKIRSIKAHEPSRSSWHRRLSQAFRRAIASGEVDALANEQIVQIVVVKPGPWNRVRLTPACRAPKAAQVFHLSLNSPMVLITVLSYMSLLMRPDCSLELPRPRNSTFALSTNGTVFAWGENKEGQPRRDLAATSRFRCCPLLLFTESSLVAMGSGVHILVSVPVYTELLRNVGEYTRSTQCVCVYTSKCIHF